MSLRRHSSAFTLIELLVAMAIVAVVGAMAFGGINLVIDQRELARERVERWREVQLAFRLIVQDLAQLHPRPVREEFGEGHLPALLSTVNSQFALEFSRGGWPNPSGLPRGTVARIAYDWEDDKLVRYHWPVLDRTPDVVPVRTELLDGVISVETRFMDGNGNWQTEWPQLDNVIEGGPLQNVNRPRTVEFLVELEDLGRLWRIVETSG
ncbi:MAG TPA: type II secretion system minor pseudopilin GspJ [Gammaproteobacteria bacterium]|nr:type II secretion system minor pseudopilin GspJ [Gammaproteobacteria bacterium]